MDRSELVGVYLAAGQSKRMGQDKLALPFGRQPLGAVSLAKALRSNLNRIIIVINNHVVPSWLSAFLLRSPEAWKCDVVVCPDASEGMSCTIREGIRKAQSWKARAAMMILADQPFITTQMLNEIIERFDSAQEAGPEIRYAAPAFGDISSPPILFAKEAFPELLKLKGDIGAKQILKQLVGITLDYAEPTLFYDIDYVAQYEALRSLTSAEDRAVMDGTFATDLIGFKRSESEAFRDFLI